MRDEVTAAVRKRLVADVPLGALLSGGIDSAIVVAQMAQASAEPCGRSPSASPTSATTSASSRARSPTATRRATRRSCSSPTPPATLPRLAAAFDEPLGDEAALPLFLICEAARREVTVALVGDGGDESFAGYERYAAMGLADRVPAPAAAAGARLLRALPAGRARAALDARSAPRASSRPPRCRARERYGRLMEVLLARRARGALDGRRESRDRRRSSSPGFLLGARAGAGVAGLQLLDLDTYLPGDLLPKSDIASMAHSLELRSPLLDHRVRRARAGAARPPEAARARGQDRAAARVRRRPAAARRARAARRGFGVPLAAWFRGELRPLARESCSTSERARGLVPTATRSSACSTSTPPDAQTTATGSGRS